MFSVSCIFTSSVRVTSSRQKQVKKKKIRRPTMNEARPAIYQLLA